MSDFTPAVGKLLSNPVTGAQLAAWANDLAAFALSGGYGSSVPTHADAGLIWSKNTGGVPDGYIFDGTDSHKLYSAANILGTVAGDGSGNNTGAIVETGYSSDTAYAKFAGGLAMATARLNNHPSGTEVWSMPSGLTFTDTDKMWAVASCRPQAYPRIVTLAAATVSSFDVAVWQPDGTPANALVTALAFGFWTEEFV